MTLEQVRDVIVETLNCETNQVTLDARLREDLGADSLAAVELCMALEEACGVSIEDELLPTLKTVRDIMDYLKGYTE